MLEKTTLGARSGLGVIQSDCGQCGATRRIQVNRIGHYAQGGGDQFFGARCRKCDTTIWANIGTNGTLGMLYTRPVGISIDAHLLTVSQAFLQSLPACPHCASSESKDFVSPINPTEKVLACGSCQAALPPYREVTATSLDMDVYLYWENEEDMKKDQRLRILRSQKGTNE